MTVAVIAEQAELQRSVVHQLLGTLRGYKRSRRIRPATEDAVLAVHLDPPVVKVAELTTREAYGLTFDAVPDDDGLDAAWRTQARCKDPDTPTWLFFPNRGDGETSKRAQEFCATCRVKRPCLEFALATGALGIWGGKTELQREQMRGLRRGHPQSA